MALQYKKIWRAVACLCTQDLGGGRDCSVLCVDHAMLKVRAFVTSADCGRISIVVPTAVLPPVLMAVVRVYVHVSRQSEVGAHTAYHIHDYLSAVLHPSLL